MAWVMLWTIVALVAIVLAAFLAAVFKTNNTTAQVLLGVLDGTLGWCLKALIAHLFPSPFAKAQKQKASSTHV
jgi:cytochrome c biogenesis protein CcdA